MAFRFAHPESEKKMLQRQRRHSGFAARIECLFGTDRFRGIFRIAFPNAWIKDVAS
jgi:hypothetical protein